MHSVKITDTPDGGSLTLSGSAVSDGDVISASDISSGNLVFTPADDSDANQNINFQVSDNGTDWSATHETTITVDAVADAVTLSVSIDVASSSSTSGGTTISSSSDKIKNDSKEYDLEDSTKDFEVDIKSYKEGQDDGQVKIYFEDGTTKTYEIDDLLPGTANNEEATMSFSESKNVDKIEVISNNNKEFRIEGVRTIGESSYENALNISTSTTDTDGSESLSITIEDIPTGATLTNTAGDTISISGNSATVSSSQLDGLTLVTTSLLSTGDTIKITSNATDGSSTTSKVVEYEVPEASETLTYDDHVDDETISTGSGDDTISVTDSKDIKGTTDIQTNAGNDIINASDYIEDDVSIATGSGNDEINVGDEIKDDAKIDMGSGDDTLNVVDDIQGNAQVDMGVGNDTINVGDEINNNAKIDMGDGDDTLNVGDDIDGSGVEIDMGSGNDTLNVTDDIQGDSKVDMGTGDDTITLGGSDAKIEGDSTIDFGEGLDALVFDAGMEIDMSAIDDQVSNLEVIKLDTGTQNITSLHTSDVLNMTDDDNILRIDGDNDDHVAIDSSEWKLGNFQTTDEITGQTYNVYESADDSGATLEINTDVTIDQS